MDSINRTVDVSRDRTGATGCCEIQQSSNCCDVSIIGVAVLPFC
jgi:hypothetical protein